MNGCHISKALADVGSYWQAHCSQYVSQLITSNFIFSSELFDKLAVISLLCNSWRGPSPGAAGSFSPLLCVFTPREKWSTQAKDYKKEDVSGEGSKLNLKLV